MNEISANTSNMIPRIPQTEHHFCQNQNQLRGLEGYLLDTELAPINVRTFLVCVMAGPRPKVAFGGHFVVPVK
jgi:hypothetical protein